MRRSRHLNRSELWELAALMGLLVVLFFGLALGWRMGHVPRLLASAEIAPPPALPVTAGTGAIQKQHAPLAARHRPIYQTLRPRHLIVRNRHANMPRPAVVAPPRKPIGFWYHGQHFVRWEHLRLVVTSYAPDRVCCWPYPGTTTASGKSVRTNDGHLVAADTNLIPMGMMVRVPGYDHNRPVPVLDRGGAIVGYRLDVLKPTLWQAQHWGRRLLMVEIYRPVASR